MRGALTKAIRRRALPMHYLEGHTTGKGIERRLRKNILRARQTNGCAPPPEREWPAAGHWRRAR